MDLFWKAVAGVLISLVLGLSIGKDMSVLLSMVVCTMGAMIAMEYVEPVIELLWEIEETARLQENMLGILLKALGVGIVTEIAGMICTDAGSSSLGKILKTMGSAAILWISIPVFNAFLNLLQEILGEL